MSTVNLCGKIQFVLSNFWTRLLAFYQTDMLLLLLLLLSADRERIGKLARLSPRTIRSIAEEMGMSSENLLGCLSGRRPLPSGERLATLHKILGVNGHTGNLDNGRVFYWKPRARTLEDFVSLTSEMFPKEKPVYRTDLIFSDLESSVFYCVHSDDFVVVVTPYSGLDMSHLDLEARPPMKLNISLEQFCCIPSDEARALLRKGKATWSDAVAFLKSVNISPEHAMQWGSEVQRTQVASRQANTEKTERPQASVE
jgi:hypothetical protein